MWAFFIACLFVPDDQENSVKYDYAGVGPNTFSDIRQKFPFEYEVRAWVSFWQKLVSSINLNSP